MTIDPVSLAITAALTAGQMALSASKKIEGPRLDDLKVTVADYGTPISYVYGTRRLQGCPIFFAEPLREIKRRRKTKGGKMNDFTYRGTWASLAAGHEIDAVLRVWFDKHLIYDETGVGPRSPFSLTKSSSFDILNFIRIYLGTDTQEPDPRMEATVDAKEGAGSTPAHRGTGYVFFEEIPLEKLGNRLPQISMEVADSAEVSFPDEEVAPAADWNNAARFSPDFSRLLLPAGYQFWDVATRSILIDGSFVLPSGIGSLGGFAIDSEGTIWTTGSRTFTNRALISYGPDGVGSGAIVAEIQDSDGNYILLADNVHVIRANGKDMVCVRPFLAAPYTGTYTAPLGWVARYTADLTGTEWAPYWYWSDSDEQAWTIGNDGADTIFYNLSDTSYFTANVGAITSANLQVFHYEGGGVDHFVVHNAGNLYFVDRNTHAVTGPVSIGGEDADVAFYNMPPNPASFWIGNGVTQFSEVSSVDGTTIRTLSVLSYDTGVSSDNGVYDPVNHAWVVFDAGSPSVLRWHYIDRAIGADVTLGSIVEDVAERCGIADADIDVSDLDQLVSGYSWTQGTGREIVAPLLDAYDSDLRPHNFILQGVKRGDAAIATINVAEFVRQGEEDRYKITVTQDTDLPRVLNFSFADPAGDQQANTVRVQRHFDATDGVRELSINMSTLVLTVDDARQMAERYFRRQWNGREKIVNALSPQRLAVEPADIYTLGLDDSVTRTARLTKMTVTGKENILRCEWERDAPILAGLSSSTGAPMDGRREEVILIPQVSKGFMLDISLVEDSDNGSNPIIYYGAGPYGPGLWPGATVLQSADGEDYDEEIAGVPSTSPLAWGIATDVLDDATPAVWDRGNSINVTLKNGTLTSATEAALNINPRLNQAAIGVSGAWEIIQFATATLEGDGTYTLTGLKRGRRGSEWATGGHAVGDYFVLLDAVFDEELGASDIGDTLYFKIVTQGREEEGAFPILVDPYLAESHKPYAPAHFEAVNDSGDWDFTWVRRSRIGYRWTGGLAVPLGEASEVYEVSILDGDGEEVRVISSASEAATYTDAQQNTDFGVSLDGVRALVYQISDLTDRGHGTEIEIVALNPSSDEWRLLFDNSLTSNFVHAAECEMRATAGGADQCAGGTASASSNYLGSGVYPAAQGFDNDNGSMWHSDGEAESWLAYAFAATVEVREILIRSRADNSGDPCPRIFKVQYKLGTTWLTAWEVETGDFAAAETRIFTRPD